jgi:hypothetical protein
MTDSIDLSFIRHCQFSRAAFIYKAVCELVPTQSCCELLSLNRHQFKSSFLSVLVKVVRFGNVTLNTYMRITKNKHMWEYNDNRSHEDRNETNSRKVWISNYTSEQWLCRTQFLCSILISLHFTLDFNNFVGNMPAYACDFGINVSSLFTTKCILMPNLHYVCSSARAMYFTKKIKTMIYCAMDTKG